MHQGFNPGTWGVGTVNRGHRLRTDVMGDAIRRVGDWTNRRARPRRDRSVIGRSSTSPSSIRFAIEYRLAGLPVKVHRPRASWEKHRRVPEHLIEMIGMKRMESLDRPTSNRHDRVAAWTQQLRHTRALRAVLERFDAAKIPALPVKGIISAHTLYTDIAERLLTDVDLKIRPRDFDRVLTLGRREGWRVVQRMRAYSNVVFVVHGVSIDIEGYPSVPGLSRLTVEAMIERATPSTVLGFPHLLPNFDDHAVLLLLNVFKDKLVHAFAWAVKDVERLPMQRAFDPLRLVEDLREAGATTIGWVVSDWMVRERQVREWRAVRDAIGPRPPRPRYVTALRWLREAQPRGTLPLRVLARAGADQRTDQVTALLRMVWWQTEAWISQWGEAPFHRQDPAQLRGTIANESQEAPGRAIPPKDGV